MLGFDSKGNSARRVSLAIFVCALLVRCIFVLLFSTEPVNDLLWNDAVGWNLATGHGYTASQTEPRVPGIFRTPGYPFFLAFIYMIFGHSYVNVYFAQAVLDSFSAVVLYRIASRYVSTEIALLSGFLYALYPYPAIFCGVLHQDILLIFSTLIVLLLLARAKQNSNQNSLWFVIGGSVALTALVKANFIFFIAVPMLTLFFIHDVKKITSIALMIGGFILFLSPWVIRNYLIFHAFPPLATGHSGIGLLMLEDEIKGEDPLLTRWAAQPARDVKNFLDGAQSIELEKKEAREALSFLRNHWPQYCVVMIKHIPNLWLTRYSRWQSGRVALAGKILSWLVLIPGLIGMWILRHRWRELLPLYLTIIIITLFHIPYVVEARYTLPARPIMLIFVAATILNFVRYLRAFRSAAPMSAGSGS
ncbi:MAG: hypothetical protein C5B54_00655 [Acidobacteria bacterium]|nr:MAG: hypothetical protein C5B54_00655 [Acidobacteriota bacterium]